MWSPSLLKFQAYGSVHEREPDWSNWDVSPRIPRADSEPGLCLMPRPFNRFYRSGMGVSATITTCLCIWRVRTQVSEGRSLTWALFWEVDLLQSVLRNLFRHRHSGKSFVCGQTPTSRCSRIQDSLHNLCNGSQVLPSLETNLGTSRADRAQATAGLNGHGLSLHCPKAVHLFQIVYCVSVL